MSNNFLRRSKDVLPAADRVFLEPWEEIHGRVEFVERLDDDLIVALSSGYLRYPVSSREAQILLNQLDQAEGALVGVLRTDCSTNPIVVNFRDVG